MCLTRKLSRKKHPSRKHWLQNVWFLTKNHPVHLFLHHAITYLVLHWTPKFIRDPFVTGCLGVDQPVYRLRWIDLWMSRHFQYKHHNKNGKTSEFNGWNYLRWREMSFGVSQTPVNYSDSEKPGHISASQNVPVKPSHSEGDSQSTYILSGS